MVPLPTPEEAPQALLELTSRLRQSAEATIVQAFRASVEGRSDGPTDDELKVFARLVAYEVRLRRRQADARPPAEPAQTLAQPAAVQVRKPAWRRFGPLVAASVVAFLVGVGAMRAQMPMVPSVVSVSPTAPRATPEVPAVAAAVVPSAQRNAARSPPSAPTRVARTATVGTPWAVARCSGLNFFSRAICMNNACAMASMTRHPVCADSVRQRRIDDARRNPLMLN